MIGVAEYENFKSGPYPGHPKVKGISLYGANGHLYRNGGNQGFVNAFHYGDRIGLLVDISGDKRSATLTYVIDGAKVQSQGALNLRSYMNIEDGIVFTVGLHDVGDEVR